MKNLLGLLMLPFAIPVLVIGLVVLQVKVFYEIFSKNEAK